jgi:hypothetical protein
MNFNGEVYCFVAVFLIRLFPVGKAYHEVRYLFILFEELLL